MWLVIVALDQVLVDAAKSRIAMALGSVIGEHTCALLR
jgi:hypothetical protein